MKTLKKLILIAITLLFFISGNTISIAYADNSYYLGGEIYGFDMFTNGVTVIGLCDVITETKCYSPAKDAGIKPGDVILKINHTDVNSESEINDLLTDKLTVVDVEREDKDLSFILYPAMDISGEYKLGVFVRNNISGIGTVTYVDSNGNFGALGHEIVNEKNQITDIVGGKVYPCGVTSIIKGKKGCPGEIQGFLKRNSLLGDIYNANECGIYGKITNFKNSKKVELSNDATIGPAYAYSHISGEAKYYKISIIKVDNSNNTKNFVIKIDDETLLNTTGGIIQGMSGTPIIQNDKLIGAITHVFINDSTRGYGININNMINNCNK